MHKYPLVDLMEPEPFVDEQGPLAGSSTAPSHSSSPAEDKAKKALADDIFVPPGGEDPPPQFTPYEAHYFTSGGSGDIISHDTHLNEDGEALYRFLLAIAQTYPGYLLHIRGTHTEHRTRFVERRDGQGNIRSETESYTETVTDFDFSINVGQYIVAGPAHWSVPDEQPAFRGRMFKEIDDPDAEMGTTTRRRAASRAEVKAAKEWSKERKVRGLPPWVGPGVESVDPTNPQMQHMHVLKSSKSLREWADEYCACKKPLKEFTYKKQIYGWDMVNLQAAIIAAIHSTYWRGDLTVKFTPLNAKIHIRPYNWLSRTLSNRWLKFLLWLLLVYPFIWLYKRFFGGARWEVCGGAYALKAWQRVEAQELSWDQPPPPFSGMPPSDGRIVQTNTGIARLTGLREGEWFQMWEGTIRQAVMNRLQDDRPIMIPSGGPTVAAMQLDGYNPVYTHPV